jgi:hypothetical protein
MVIAGAAAAAPQLHAIARIGNAALNATATNPIETPRNRLIAFSFFNTARRLNIWVVNASADAISNMHRAAGKLKQRACRKPNLRNKRVGS